MLLFLVTLFILSSILSLRELHALSLYKPLLLFVSIRQNTYSPKVSLSFQPQERLKWDIDHELNHVHSGTPHKGSGADPGGGGVDWVSSHPPMG